MITREIDPRVGRETIAQEMKGSNACFFLESGVLGNGIGRYSYAGTHLCRAIISKGSDIVTLDGSETSRSSGNPFHALRDLLAALPHPADIPVPFTGGAVGYLGYELNQFVEQVPQASVDEIMIPDMFFGCFGKLWIIDHKLDRAYTVTAEGLGPAPEVPDLWRSDPISDAPDHLESSFTRNEYIRAVERAKEYIAAGDIFQVNLSQRFRTRLHLDPFDLFLALQKTNPAPYSAFLRLGSASVVSCSPELFLKVRGGHATTRPIKGTRPRGSLAGEDERLAEELMCSAKDAAELAMIVDLERNDLGRVCRYGTVKVTAPKVLESYASVHHLVATVEGELRDDCDTVDLLSATFPGGSITGAPKIRSMEIIAELEPTTRGVYTGSIGCIAANGNVDLNIAIRTITTRGNCAFFSVGGGIVADSDPENEFEETLHKGAKLAEVLQGQASLGSPGPLEGVAAVPEEGGP